MKRQVIVKQTVTIYGTAKTMITKQNMSSVIEPIEDVIAKYCKSEFDIAEVEIGNTEEFRVTYDVLVSAIHTYTLQTRFEPAESELDPNETFEKLESILNEAIENVTFSVTVSDDYEIVEECEPECFWDNER